MNWDIIFPKPQTFGNGPIKIACIGDSITYGLGVMDDRLSTYPAILFSQLNSNYTVKNFGVSNRTATNCYPYGYIFSGMVGKILRFKPKLALICLGTNDSKPKIWGKNFIKDYKKLVKKLISKNVQVILLSPPKVFSQFNPSDKHSINDEIIKMDIKKSIFDIAKEYNLQTIDLYPVLNDNKYFVDGVHPNTQGNKLLAEKIAKTILNNQN